MHRLPFYELSDDEYRSLSTAEKIDYLRRAIEAIGAVDQQIADRIDQAVTESIAEPWSARR